MNVKTVEFPNETTEEKLLDAFPQHGVISYGGYWVIYSIRMDTGKATSAVYSYDGNGGLDKMLEVSGGIDTGSAIKVALDTIDNIREMED